MRTKKGFRLRKLGAEYILTPEGLEAVGLNRMISLNSTAAYLWKKVEGKEFTVERLEELLVGGYGIDGDTARRDAGKVADELIRAGVVEK